MDLSLTQFRVIPANQVFLAEWQYTGLSISSRKIQENAEMFKRTEVLQYSKLEIKSHQQTHPFIPAIILSSMIFLFWCE